MTKRSTKKIVVLGVGPEHQAVYEDALKEHKIIFVSTSHDAFGVLKNTDVVAVNIDNHTSFIDQAFNRGYSGKIVVITNSRKRMNKVTELPDGVKVSPVCCRTAPEEIIRYLAI
ncbi:MAG: hypothetical protein WBC83_03390 [Minisyncoccia bacterium]